MNIVYEFVTLVRVEDDGHRQYEHQHEADDEVDHSPKEVHVVGQLHAITSPDILNRAYFAQAMSRGIAKIRYPAKDNTPIYNNTGLRRGLYIARYL